MCSKILLTQTRHVNADYFVWTSQDFVCFFVNHMPCIYFLFAFRPMVLKAKRKDIHKSYYYYFNFYY